MRGDLDERTLGTKQQYEHHLQNIKKLSPHREVMDKMCMVIEASCNMTNRNTAVEAVSIKEKGSPNLLSSNFKQVIVLFMHNA